MSRKNGPLSPIEWFHLIYTDTVGDSCEMFNKAYNHISERIDQVYKDLTKGKASPMGGVAYLSLEDSEVSTTAYKVIPSKAFFA